MSADKADVIFKPWAAGAKFTNPDGTLTMQAIHFIQAMAGNANGSPTVGVVTNLTAVGIEHGYRISATLPNELDLAYVELWMSSDNILAHATRITWGLASTYDQTGFSAADGTKYFWVRCVNLTNVKGAFVGPVSCVAGITATPGSVTGLTATGIIGGFRIAGTLPADPDLAYVEVWMGTTNVLGAATRITWGLASSYDQLGFVPSDGVRYFWVRCVSTSGQLGAFVGPVSATAGQVQAGNIASGAVQVAAFASGIEPVTIVSSVPVSLSTQTIFNTSNGKLYRWNGAAYIVTTPTSDLSGQISAGQIAANAVTAGTIAANAVTAGTIAAAAVSTSELSSSAIFAGSLQVGGTAYIDGNQTVDTYSNALTVNNSLARPVGGYFKTNTNLAGGGYAGLFSSTNGGVAVHGISQGGSSGYAGLFNALTSGHTAVRAAALTAGATALEVYGPMVMTGDAAITGNLSATKTLTAGTFTVATLPAAATYPGGRAGVSDALAPTFSAIVAGGGTVPVPVYSDGTNWRVG